MSGENVYAAPGSPQQFSVYVAVSRAEDGSAVNGLLEDNFEVAWPVAGAASDVVVAGQFAEFNLEAGRSGPSGLYLLNLLPTLSPSPFFAAVFLVRVHTDEDQGQGIVRLVSETTET